VVGIGSESLPEDLLLLLETLPQEDAEVIERALRGASLHDELTGLANRALFTDRLERAVARLRRHPATLAVLFIDLDRFKLVNDGFGHDVGDKLLIAVAESLRTAVRETDTIARLGGDEFVVLAEELSDEREALELGERVVAALTGPVLLEGEEVLSSASVGVATASDPERRAKDLMCEADTAMYRAKALGRGRCDLFDHEMRAAVTRRVSLESALRHAVAREELRLLYQPVITLADASVLGYEALVRWEHEDRMLQPAEFLALAEETGVILEMGDWVMHEACRRAAAWRANGSTANVSVNASARELLSGQVARRAERVLSATGLPPAALTVEVPDGPLAQAPERLRPELLALRRLGVRIAIDDFGSGLSTLRHLRTLPIDALKIDRTYVRSLSYSPNDRAIVAAIVSLAHEMELEVIAKGVEDDAQRAELLALGVTRGQGFLYARPG
jgi:diguanylate cyclase (GGDEF)-like protein